MSVTAAGPMPALTPEGAIVERHWQQLATRRRFYTIGGLVLLLLALSVREPAGVSASPIVTGTAPVAESSLML